jgi:quercetin dioxygenase-like cupin family protein
VTFNAAYFAYHVSEIAPFRHEEGYEGRRLNSLWGGAIEGREPGAHAQLLDCYLPAGRRLLSHWHVDREALFYCLGGSGRFLLDEHARPVRPGDAMFQPLGAVHGADNPGGEHLRYVEVVMPVTRPSPLPAGERCFTSLAASAAVEARGATWRPLFPPGTYGQQVDWIGELQLAAGRSLETLADPDAELTLLVLEGEGAAQIEGVELPIRAGSILYLPAGFEHGLSARAGLRLFGVRASAGRAFVPRLLRRGSA